MGFIMPRLCPVSNQVMNYGGLLRTGHWPLATALPAGRFFGDFVGALAVGADAEDAVAVAQRLELVAAGDLVLQALDLFAVELDERAAFGADQVVVMRVFVFVLVEHAP